MFKYLPILIFIFLCQAQGYAFAQSDTKILPLKLEKPNNSNDSEIADELDKRHVVVMNGHNNYHVGQQVFYIYNEQQFKRPLPNNKEKLEGYVVTPGLSAHKLHPRKLTWNRARQACIQEGGHLAIINSESEEKVLLHMLKEKNIVQGWLGIHDCFEEGDWVTVKGETLETTGYTRWTTKWPNEPDNVGGNQNCAALISDGGMDDLKCSTLISFFCEIPL